MELMENALEELCEPLDFTNLSPVERLPQGPAGMSGEVWRMKQMRSGLQCVFKMMVVPLSSEQEIDDNLQALKEAWRSGSAGAGLHPGIATLIDCTYDCEQQRFVIATEWMDALSLRDHMRHGERIPERAVGCIAMQVANALAFLHKHCHRAHRDLKPGNVLLSCAGEAKITDLGQSKQLEQTRGVMGSYVGAQIYMSPQRILGGEYTSSCDVWSLGLMTHECMIGEFPYLAMLRASNIEPNNATVMEVMEEGPPLPLDTGDFSQEACSFCSATMEHSEASRPTSMQLVEHSFLTGNSDRSALIHWIASSLPRIQRQEYQDD